MKNTKKSSAKASSASQRTTKAWKTREANKIKAAKEIETLKSENLEFYVKNCELATEIEKLKKTETTASELFNKQVGVANEIEKLKAELKVIDIDIINMKAKLNSELNILS